MFVLSEAMIKDAATNAEVYQRGLLYFRSQRVTEFEFAQEELYASALVLGSEAYEVEVRFDAAGEIFDMYCECPAFTKYPGACKHIVALLKKCREEQNSSQQRPKVSRGKSQAADELFRSFENNLHASEKIPLNLEINLETDYVYKYGTKETALAVSLRLGEEKLYIVKNLKQLLEALEQGEEIAYGKNFSFVPGIHVFKPKDKPVLDLLREIYELEKNILKERPGFGGWRSGQGKLFDGKQVILPQAALKRFFALLQERSFNVKLFDREYRDLTIVEQDLPLNFRLEKDNDDLLLGWEQADLFPLIGTGEYFFFGGKVYQVSEPQRKYFAPLFNAFLNSPEGVRFSQQQQERFVSEILPAVKKIGQVAIAPPVGESLYQVDLRTEIRLDRAGDAVTAKVEFIYGEIRINPFAGKSDYQRNDQILVRDPEQERTILSLLERAEFRTVNGSIHLEDEEKIFYFVYQLLPELQEVAEVFYAESFRNMRVRDEASFSGGVRLNEESEMLEFSFQLGDIDPAELQDVFKSLREKKKYYRLKDGSFLPLDTAGAELDGVRNMIDSLDLSERELQQGTVELPRYRALYVDRCLQELKPKYFEKNPAFKQLVQNINEPQDMEFKTPAGLQAALRDYQKKGFKWLKTLAMYGLGGILADDMGLGKTLQALAFILSEKARVQAPSLVVAPTSVVYNWLEEAKRFAPSLEVTVIAGTQKERKLQLEKAEKSDLIITSYALIRRDVEYYQDFNFSYCFLDEAQQVKNPNSQSARAVKTIKAKGYFALTGTPVENSLLELWSIFDFVMRGYLFSRQKFRRKFEQPIVKNQNANALKELQKQMAPFILRRLKKDVLKELPPKFESKMLTELTREQKKIYLAYLQQAKAEIELEIASRGFKKSQIKILAVLTRLRQICCHPAMFLDNYQSDSGKLLHLKEILQDALKGGHRVLLFSQFTTMLGIIKKLLDQDQVSYFYLDGSTKAEQRNEMVRAFNQGAGDIFLISLKAGGIGLNLTGADLVIHYDPWWNPAVEEQATDRAYRIGQKNSVQVIKLITRGTIEEKIFELQQQKKALIDSVIKPGETMITKMTEQEVRELFSAV